jgi:hypothetical protein
MAPPKKSAQELSQHPSSKSERKRRAQPGFEGDVIRKKRSNESSHQNKLKKLKESDVYKNASKVKQKALIQKCRADTDAML